MSDDDLIERVARAWADIDRRRDRFEDLKQYTRIIYINNATELLRRAGLLEQNGEN